MRTTRLGEPLPVSLLSWSRGGLVNGSIASQYRLGFEHYHTVAITKPPLL